MVAASYTGLLKAVSLDEIDVGLGTGDAETSRSFIYLRRDQIRSFLKHQKRKDLLSIRTSTCTGREIPGLRDFVSELGYKRDLILGNQCEGVFALYDSAYKTRERQQPLRSRL